MTDRPALDRVREVERIEVRAWRDVAAAATPELVRRFGIRSEDFAGGLALSVAAAPNTIWNRAWGFALEQPLEERELERLLGWFPRERPFTIQPSPAARPRTIGAWLETRGLASRFRWVKWARGADPPDDEAAAVEIAPVARERAMEYARLSGIVFDEDAGLDAWIAAVVGRPGWTHYLALDRQQPVGCGALFVSGHLAWLGWGGTLPGHRRRGIQRALIARRIRDAALQGARVLASDTAEDLPERSNPSYRNMARAGFEVLYRRASHAWFPARVPASD